MQKDKFILRQAAVPCDVGMQRSACDCILSRYVRRNVAIKSVSEIVTILQFIDKLGNCHTQKEELVLRYFGYSVRFKSLHCSTTKS